MCFICINCRTVNAIYSNTPLFINLLTDSLPAIAIGMEPSDDSLLKEKPRNPKEGILTKYFIIKIMLQEH